MIPGEILFAEGPVVCNEGRPVTRLTVLNAVRPAREGGPGVTTAGLLVVNKTDLAPYAGAMGGPLGGDRFGASPHGPNWARRHGWCCARSRCSDAPGRNRGGSAAV
ncbi:hypothetical protein [Streptomyces sp. NPDC004065]|uniref:hypothetical protein n=1 Tax=Streptomyces sp. NPDC004065 TaxID=3364689 RepID=UPI00384DA019